MKKLDSKQVEFIAKVETAAQKMEPFILEARKLHLWILERELIHQQKQLRDGIELQTRAFRDDSLVDPEPLFPHGFFPYGKKDQDPPVHWCANCSGFRPYTHECKPVK